MKNLEPHEAGSARDVCYGSKGLIQAHSETTWFVIAGERLAQRRERQLLCRGSGVWGVLTLSLSFQLSLEAV